MHMLNEIRGAGFIDTLIIQKLKALEKYDISIL